MPVFETFITTYTLYSYKSIQSASTFFHLVRSDATPFQDRLSSTETSSVVGNRVPFVGGPAANDTLIMRPIFINESLKNDYLDT